MMYQCNTLISATIALVGLIFFFHYVKENSEKILFWHEKCEPGFDCLKLYFAGPPSPSDKTVLEVLKEKYLIPPPKNYKAQGFDIYSPVWRKLVDWYKVQEKLIDVYEDQPPGVFVEVGAVDGDFMSQTLYLEKNLSWSGLLIEPDPRSFAVLKESGRNAWLSPICVFYHYPSMRKYWLRTLEEDLPHHFTQLLMARSKLDSETYSGDEERGSNVWVPCAPLSAVLNSINMKSIDLLTIATGEAEDYEKIKDALNSKTIDVKSVLMHYPTAVLYNNPFPKISGYIMDIKRSLMIIKMYHKTSHCKLLSNSTCELVNFYVELEACHTYICFEHLTVRTFDPKLSLLIHYPTAVLYSNPYPAVKGYIMDFKRSEMIIKLYHKLSHCKLLSQSTCEKVNFYDAVEACFVYLCFDRLTVQTINPKVIIRAPV